MKDGGWRVDGGGWRMENEKWMFEECFYESTSQYNWASLCAVSR
jgi:hypothetical protein